MLTVLFMVVFCHTFLFGYKIGMISRITLTAATYQKVANECWAESEQYDIVLVFERI